MTVDLGQQVQYLIKEIIQLTYFMRGAISYDAMLDKSFAERQAIASYIDERLESESKKFNPNY